MATATYPVSVQTFPGINPRIDNTSPVMANDVNVLYAEVVAIEGVLGLTPNKDVDSYSWPTVSARIAQLENVIKSTNAVVKAGGSTILPTDSSYVGLKIQAKPLSTANLQEWKNSDGDTKTFVNKDGYIATIDGGTA
jgi:hypothetical protein